MRYGPGCVRPLVRHLPGLSRRLSSPLRAGERSAVYPVRRAPAQVGADLHKGLRFAGLGRRRRGAGGRGGTMEDLLQRGQIHLKTLE